MEGAWGYPAKDTVQVTVPTDLAETVASFVADPDAFMAALQNVERTLDLVLVEVEPGTWIDPRRIVATQFITGAAPRTRLLFAGGALEVDGEPSAVLNRIRGSVGPQQ